MRIPGGARITSHLTNGSVAGTPDDELFRARPGLKLHCCIPSATAPLDVLAPSGGASLIPERTKGSASDKGEVGRMRYVKMAVDAALGDERQGSSRTA